MRTFSAVRQAKSVSLSLRAGNERDWTEQEGRIGATVFHSWAWLSWIAPLIECDFVPLVVEAEGAIVGLAPVLLRRRRGLRTMNLVPFPYLGPMVKPEHLTETSRLLMHWGRRHRVMRSRQESMSASAHEGRFAEAGLTEEGDQSYVISLSGKSPQAVFGSFTRDIRQAVRRSVKHGVEIRGSTSMEIAEVLPALHAHALGAPTNYTRRIAVGLLRNEPEVPFHVSTAVFEGRPIGMSLAIGGPITMGWIGGVFRDAQYTQANTALIWDAVQWAHARGSHAFDLLRAPSPGIEAYKKKFSPDLVPYRVATWEPTAVKWVSRAQATLRRTSADSHT